MTDKEAEDLFRTILRKARPFQVRAGRKWDRETFPDSGEATFSEIPSPEGALISFLKGKKLSTSMASFTYKEASHEASRYVSNKN
jgi:hypothetical protein